VSLKGAGNYGKARKIIFHILKIFGDAKLEEKFLNGKYEDIIEDKVCKKTE